MAMATTATPATLQRLLARLDHTLFGPNGNGDGDGHAWLRTSPYERNRIGANIEHARTLLLSLEKQSATVRVSQQHQLLQTDLEQKREWIKRLNNKLRQLNAAGERQAAEAGEESNDEGEGEDEDEDHHNDDDDDDDHDHDEHQEHILQKYGPARHDTEAGLETGGDGGDTTVREGVGGGRGAGGINASHVQQALSSQLQQEIRSRGQAQAHLTVSDNRLAASTTAREQLFASRTQASTPAPAPADHGSIHATETLMAHNRTEQEVLTTGLLGLARLLKDQSQQFGASLEAEKDVLKDAEGGLDKNALGMDAAAQKMGTLRKMSEGQGWWGRMKLYAMIVGLWLACFLVVFVGPKIRF